MSFTYNQVGDVIFLVEVLDASSLVEVEILTVVLQL